MNKIITCLFVFLFFNTFLFSQEEILSKIPCTPKADKIFSLNELNDLISFRSGKMWGLYDSNEGKIVIPAKFDFIIPGDANKHYVILNEKVGWYDSNGEELLTGGYFRLGEVYNYQDYFIRNDSLIGNYGETDLSNSFSSKKAEFKFYSMDRKNVFAVEVKKNLLVISNSYEDSEGSPLLTVDGGDSVDIEGFSVYGFRETEQKSGIIDISTGEWVVKPEYFAILSIGENFLVKRNVRLGESEVYSELKLMDKGYKIIKDFGYHHQIVWNDENIKLLLPYKEVSGIQLQSTDLVGDSVFGFYHQDKFGIFNTGLLEVIKLPINEFEFISESQDLECNVIKKKLNCKCKFGEFETDEKNLDSIGIYELREGDYTYGYYLRKNDKYYNYEYGKSPKLVDHESLPSLQLAASVSVSGNYLIVNEFLPMGPEPTDPIMVMDEFGEIRDSIAGYDLNGNPIVCYPAAMPSVSSSGVYHLLQRKWIVERKFSKIFSTSTGFSCITERDNDYHVYYSAFDRSGNPIFLDISDSMVFASDNLLKKFIGFSDPFNVELLPVDYRNNIYFWWQPVKLFINGKWGIFEVKSHKWLIVPEYDQISMLYNQTFLVSKNKKLGIISTDGKIIIEPNYNKLESSVNRNIILDDKKVMNGFEYPNSINLSADIYDVNVNKIYNSYLPGLLYYFNAYISENKLFINEHNNNLEEYVIQIYDEYYGSYDSLDADGNPVIGYNGENSTNTRVYDFPSSKWIKFDSVHRIVPANNNYIIQYQNGNLKYADKNLNTVSPSSGIAYSASSLGISELNVQQLIYNSNISIDTLRLTKLNAAIFGLNSGDYSIEKITYDRYLFSNSGKHVLINGSGKIIVDKADEISVSSFEYLNYGEELLNPVFLEVKKENRHFIYNTDGVIVSEVFPVSGSIQRLSKINSAMDKYWFNNGRTLRLANYNGKDIILSPVEWDSVGFCIESVNEKNEKKSFYNCYKGNTSSLMDENGKLYLKLNGNEKVWNAGIRNVVFIESPNGKTKLFEPEKGKYHQFEFSASPKILHTFTIDSLNAEINIVSMKKGNGIEIYLIRKQNGNLSVEKEAVLDYDNIEFATFDKLFIAKRKNDHFLLNGNDKYSSVFDESMKNIFSYGMLQEYVVGFNDGNLSVVDVFDSMRVTEFKVANLDSVFPNYSEEVMYSSAKPALYLYRNGKSGIYDMVTETFLQPDFTTFRIFFYNIWIVDERLYDVQKENFITDKTIKEFISVDYYNYILKMTDGSTMLYSYESQDVKSYPFNVEKQVWNDYYSASLNGKYGLIKFDSSQWILKPEYDTIYSWANKYTETPFPMVAKKSGVTQYMANDFKVQIQGKFDYIEPFTNWDEVTFFSVMSKNKTGIVDKKGKTIIPEIYDQIYSYYDLFYTVDHAIGSDGNEIELVGLTDRKGKVVLPAKYIRITEPEMEGYFCTVKDSSDKVYLVKYKKGKKAKLIEFSPPAEGSN